MHAISSSRSWSAGSGELHCDTTPATMKAMGGGGGSFSKSSAKHVEQKPVKAKKGPKQMSHSELAALWQAQGGKFAVEEKKEWTKADIEHARAAKERAEQAARDAKKPQMVAADDAGEELEVLKEKTSQELLQERMAGLLTAMQSLGLEAAATSTDAGAPADDDPETIAECRRSQLAELEMLDAMYPEEYRLLSDASARDALQAALDHVDACDSSETPAALAAVAACPPLEFALHVTAVADEAAQGGAADGADETRLAIAILLRVQLPARYPMAGAAPELLIEDAMVSNADAHALVDAGRRGLDEDALLAAMRTQATAALPAPCVYEVVSWLLEHAFDFARRDVVAQL